MKKYPDYLVPLNIAKEKTLTLSDAFIEELELLFRNVYKDDYIRSRNENYNNMSKRLSRRKILGRK